MPVPCVKYGHTERARHRVAADPEPRPRAHTEIRVAAAGGSITQSQLSQKKRPRVGQLPGRPGRPFGEIDLRPDVLLEESVRELGEPGLGRRMNRRAMRGRAIAGDVIADGRGLGHLSGAYLILAETVHELGILGIIAETRGLSGRRARGASHRMGNVDALRMAMAPARYRRRPPWAAVASAREARRRRLGLGHGLGNRTGQGLGARRRTGNEFGGRRRVRRRLDRRARSRSGSGRCGQRLPLVEECKMVTNPNRALGCLHGGHRHRRRHQH